MAENTSIGAKEKPLPAQTLAEVRRLLWGANLKEDVFQRWGQGFLFSEDEPTALVQCEGGPCAIIAPVQAYVLKFALFKYEDNWKDASVESSLIFLVSALCEILAQNATDGIFFVFTHYGEARLEDQEMDQGSSCGQGKLDESCLKDIFRIIKVQTMEELEQAYRLRLRSLSQPFAVLAFLYSVLLTKGIDQIKNEMEDPNESLIDGTHGHGSQSLINLMLTGKAVSNVWDNDKDVSGLQLRGISKQSQIGFLTLLEHLRYCEVGWFLKCPEYPIWLVGSETHLTVLFSKEKRLVSPETPEEAARRIFKSYDPEGNNFILSCLLEDVLKAMDLFSDPEYVEVMKQKLDGEGLGIILLNTFMDEFYPQEKESSMPESFPIFHYNGLKRSCMNGTVKYQEGTAVLPDDEIKCMTDATPILMCLQTKWPGLEVHWASGTTPSII